MLNDPTNYAEIVKQIYKDTPIIRIRNNGTSYDDIVWNTFVAPPSRAEVDAAVQQYETKRISNSFDGSLNILPIHNDGTEGVLADGGHTWVDIVGTYTPRTSANATYNPSAFYGGVYGYPHGVNGCGDLVYHVPHEYAVGTDIFLHLHWGHHCNNISGSFVVTFTVTHAPRTSTPGADVFSTPVTIPLTITGINSTNTPRYCHRVDEIQISTQGGAANMLNTADIGVDSLIMVRYNVNTIPSLSGGSRTQPFIFAADLHIQTNNIGTKNKDPNFYA